MILWTVHKLPKNYTWGGIHSQLVHFHKVSFQTKTMFNYNWGEHSEPVLGALWGSHHHSKNFRTLFLVRCCLCELHCMNILREREREQNFSFVAHHCRNLKTIDNNRLQIEMSLAAEPKTNLVTWQDIWCTCDGVRTRMEQWVDVWTTFYFCNWFCSI